jgi:hypothetical protein
MSSNRAVRSENNTTTFFFDSSTSATSGRTLFFRFAGLGVVFICCRINAALSFSPTAVADVADGAKVADVADMTDMADGVAVANGVAVTDGVSVADGVAVTEGGATVTAVGDMLVAEFGGGTTLGGTLGGGTSVDIFVRGGLWRSVATNNRI